MLDLNKALIPKPQQLITHQTVAKIAEFHAPSFTLEACGEDVRIAEGAALIRARVAELAVTDGEGSDYTVRLFVDEGHEKFKNIDKNEA